MENITVGKYVPGNSLIHRLNPFIKLSMNIIFIVLVFISQSLILLGAISAFGFIIFLLSGLRKRQLYRMLIPVTIIIVFLFILNMVLIDKGYDGTLNHINYKSSGSGYFWKGSLFTWWKIHFTDKVLFQTIFIGIRIYVMILVTTLTTSTTKPTALTKAIEQLLYPLKLLFVPVHIIAMIISIALRFIPTLIEEAQRIIKAQASRGVDFKNGGLRSKAKSMVTLVIPLFVSAFSKAEDLGNAMETRGYDPYQKRTRYRVYPVRLTDIIFGLVIISLITVIALQRDGVLPNPDWFI